MDTKEFRYNTNNGDESIALVEQKILEKRTIIEKLEGYPGVIH